jgi:hypothetical protein
VDVYCRECAPFISTCSAPVLSICKYDDDACTRAVQVHSGELMAAAVHAPQFLKIGHSVILILWIERGLLSYCDDYRGLTLCTSTD